MTNHVVNDLTEAYENATGAVREFTRVGRQLADCQQHCPEWDRGEQECTRYDRERWIELLIRPGQVCDLWHGV